MLVLAGEIQLDGRPVGKVRLKTGEETLFQERYGGLASVRSSGRASGDFVCHRETLLRRDFWASIVEMVRMPHDLGIDKGRSVELHLSFTFADEFVTATAVNVDERTAVGRPPVPYFDLVEYRLNRGRKEAAKD